MFEIPRKVVGSECVEFFRLFADVRLVVVVVPAIVMVVSSIVVVGSSIVAAVVASFIVLFLSTFEFFMAVV